jgi:hypothetical protein
MINWCFASGAERWSYSIAPSSACWLSYPRWLFTKLAAVSLMQWLRIGKRRCPLGAPLNSTYRGR